MVIAATLLGAGASIALGFVVCELRFQSTKIKQALLGEWFI